MHQNGGRVEMRKAASHGYVGGCGVGSVVFPDRGGQPFACARRGYGRHLVTRRRYAHGRSKGASHAVGSTTQNSP